MTTLTQIRQQAAWLVKLRARFIGLGWISHKNDIAMCEQVLETVRAVEGCIECSEDILRLDLAGDPIPPEAA